VAFVAGGGNGAADHYGFATIATDAADYAPGTPVVMTGSGFAPGEWVSLSLDERPAVDAHPLQPVQADQEGRLVSTEFVPNANDANIRFYLRATGQQSGLRAETTFTDATGDGTGTMTVTPNTVVIGTTSTLTFTFSSATSSTTKVALTIPSAWTAPQTANPSAAGFVSIKNGTCSPFPSSVVIAGNVIIVGDGKSTTLACAKGKTFTITYADGVAPNSADTLNFTTQTQGSATGAGLAIIAVSPQVKTRLPFVSVAV